ncbi:hypothetical protein ACFY5F_18475 [Streptomyces sp. NPDC013161]
MTTDGGKVIAEFLALFAQRDASKLAPHAPAPVTTRAALPSAPCLLP